MVLGPFFDKPPSIINKPDGSVLFECMCNANPEPTVVWFLKDKQVSGDDRHVCKVKKQVGKYICTMILKVGFIKDFWRNDRKIMWGFKSPTQADQGIYKVVATNAHGTHSVEQNYQARCVANEVFKTQ